MYPFFFYVFTVILYIIFCRVQKRGVKMTNMLIRIFIRDRENLEHPGVREAHGRLAGIVGIASNLLLFVGKMIAGWLSGSLAIMADAVNNLSDSASSVVTLAGFKLAAMPPDEKHPYGHARYEHVSGLVVSFLIIAIGVQFFRSSVGKILHPEPMAFSALTAAILLVSIAVKLWQGMFNREVGRRIQSDALRATAADSINDVIATSAVLIGALIDHFTGVMLDGWLGLAVAVFILVSGVRLVIDTLNPLIGTAPDNELVERLQEKIMDYPSVLGIHDLIIHNYGPNRCFATVHVEMPASRDVMVSHALVDAIERDIQSEMNVELVVHLDPIATDDIQLSAMQGRVAALINTLDTALSIHDFRMMEEDCQTCLVFDVVVPPRFRWDDDTLREKIIYLVQTKIDERIRCVITVDHSYTASRPTLKY